MKKLISLLITAVMIVSFLPNSFAASVEVYAVVDQETNELKVSGSCSEERTITLWVSGADIAASDVKISDLYAMKELQTEEDGSFSTTIPLSESLEYGEYKVVVGGVGKSVAESERSAVFNYEDINSFSLWLEAENATLTGNYTKKEYASESSGSARIAVDTTDTETENSVQFDFSVPGDADFDIWVLGTPGNVTHATKYQYYLDDNTPQNNTHSSLERVYSTKDSRQVPIYWTKLTEAYITKGEHKLTFTANDKREMGDFVYHVLDTVVIVPKVWNWTPNGFHKTYNTNTIKLNYTYAEKDVNTIQRGETLEVYLGTKLKEATTHDVTVWAALTKNGELVSADIRDTKVVTSKQTVNREYETTLKITVPSFAPNGTYDVVCGMGGALQSGFYQNEGTLPLTEEGFVKVGSINIGSVSTPNPEKVTFGDVELSVYKDTINAKYTLQSSNLTQNEKAFVKLWKDEVLWGVAETDSVVNTTQTQSAQSIELKLPEGIPADTYTAELGFYNANGIASAGEITTSINGKYAYKPLSNGVYTSKKTLRDHFWYVSQKNTLIWDGEPYIPVGGMQCLKLVDEYTGSLDMNESNWLGDKTELDTLIQNGVTDLYINANNAAKVPFWVWEYIFDYLEENGIRYGLQPNGTRKNNMDAFYIRSNSNVAIKTTVMTSKTVTKDVTFSEIASYGKFSPVAGYYVLLNSSGTLIESGECKLSKIDKGYRFSVDIKVPSFGVYTVAFTPMVNQNNSILRNFWDYPEENMEYLKEFGEKACIGDNFRCVVDPLNNESGYYNEVESIRPYSENYNAAYEEWLSDKYTTVSELNTAWGTSAIESFAVASRLIPLYTASNNQTDYNVYATDPETEDMYTLSGRKGVMWTDYLTFRDEMTADYYNEVSDVFKAGTDVPVVIKNVWGHKEYFVNKNQKGGFDGLGAEAYGTATRLTYLQTSCYGMGQQFGKTAWLIVTETETEENVNTKYNSGEYGYGTEQNMKEHFDALIQYGAKGIFDFLYSSRMTPQIQTAYSYISNPEMFEWANNYRKSLNIKEVAEYVPTDNKVYILPHNSNHYTSPNRYTAVLYNDDYNAVKQPFIYGNMMIMPIEDANTEVDFVAANFINGPASVAQGKKFGEMLDNMSGDKQAVYLGFRKDLGTVPQVDKYFTDKYATNSDGVKVQVLNPTSTSQIIKTAKDGSPWVIRDGNFWIVSAEDAISDTAVKYLEEINVFMNGDDVEWRDVGITKPDGSTPSTLASGEYTVKAQVKNNTDSLLNATLITATYSSDGRMTGLAMDENRIYEGLNELKTNITVSDDDAELKVFIWDSMNEMKSIMTVPGLKK